MATKIEWSLKEAVVTNNYPYKNEDGTITLIDDVITNVYVTVEAVNGDSKKSMSRFIELNKPVLESFLPLSNITKETAFSWAMATLDSNLKTSIEEVLIKMVENTAPTTRKIFGD